MVLKYYYSSVTGDMQMKTKQQRIEMILTSKKIEFERIDISSDPSAKDEMRAVIGDPKALPPQLINDDKYCGDFDAFECAVEDEKIEDFVAGSLAQGQQS